jgi:hypothetical protein
MACPYFFPIARFDDRSWAVAPRLPLGDPYTGECRAQAAAIEPEESTLRQHCNRGYGRGECDRFPPDGEADAVRFHVSVHQGTLLQIQFILEKKCWPLRHGVLEYQESVLTPADAILARQASAFAESYLRRCV